MKGSKPARKSPEETYLEAAIAFEMASEGRGGHKAINLAHDVLVGAAKELRKRKDRGQAFFTKLLEHELPHVRAWAAVHLLPLDEKLATKVLTELACGPPSDVRFDAEMTLGEWRAGTLDVDWRLP